MTRVALFTDKTPAALPCLAQVRDSLRAAGLDVAIFDECRIEPTDQSFLAAARFAAEGKFDGYVSVGGGSVMDTCKAANLYATWPAGFLDDVNAPIGKGKAVPGPLKPHIACPDRHIAAAGWLGADTRGAADEDAGEVVAKQLIAMMKATEIPNGIGGVGYTERDAPALAKGAWAQQRLLTNSPREVTPEGLEGLYLGALKYW